MIVTLNFLFSCSHWETFFQWIVNRVLTQFIKSSSITWRYLIVSLRTLTFADFFYAFCRNFTWIKGFAFRGWNLNQPKNIFPELFHTMQAYETLAQCRNFFRNLKNTQHRHCWHMSVDSIPTFEVNDKVNIRVPAFIWSCVPSVVTPAILHWNSKQHLSKGGHRTKRAYTLWLPFRTHKSFAFY